MRKTLVAACVLIAAFAATACARTIDPAATNATLVPGTSSLYRFCDQQNLIYFSKVDSDSDQFEYAIPGGCQPPTPPTPGATGGSR